MARQRMNDSWDRVRTRIERLWEDAEFSDQEMRKARGSLPEMVNLIHEKTGEPRSEISRKVSALI